MSRSWPPTTSSTGLGPRPAARPPAGQMGRIEVRLRPGGVDLERAALHQAHGRDRRVDVGERAPLAHDPGCDVGLDGGVEVAARHRLVLRSGEGGEGRGSVGEQAPTGRGQQQRTHGIRPGEGDLDGHARAERGPTRWHAVTPRWSSVASTSPSGSRAPAGGRSDSPKPRRSRRTASRTAVRPGHCGSPSGGRRHRRASSTTGMPTAGRRARRRCPRVYIRARALVSRVWVWSAFSQRAPGGRGDRLNVARPPGPWARPTPRLIEPPGAFRPTGAPSNHKVSARPAEQRVTDLTNSGGR